MNLNLNVKEYMLQIPAIMIAMMIHELVKALMSTRLGDPMPKDKGRLTMNPFKHIEPIGFICMLLLGYGWSKPTETESAYYRDGKKGTLAVYTVPILFNLIVGIIFALGSKLFGIYADYLSYAAEDHFRFIKLLKGMIQFLYYVAQYNIALGVFNLIPVYPMAGSKVFGMFLSPYDRAQVSRYEKFLQIILVLLMFSGTVGMLLDPICKAIAGF